MEPNNTAQISALLTLLLASFTTEGAGAGVDATSVRLSADAEVSGVWIDGQPARLKEHARDWTHPDDYGPRVGLRTLAVSAQAGTGLGRAGLIGVVVLEDGRWIITDDTWRAWPGPEGPPLDAQGRSWTVPDYDDRAWHFATDLGPYGTGPWGCASEPGTREVGVYTSSASGDGSNSGKSPLDLSQLDEAMRLTARLKCAGERQLKIPGGLNVPPGTNISSLMSFGQTPANLWNADWIWAGPPLGGASAAYFRKDFSGGHATPPSTPQNTHLVMVTPTRFTVAWQPCFSAQGPVRYEVGWNGQVMAQTTRTSATLDGLTINPVPQNYAWIRAVARDGTRSRPSSFVLVATPPTDVPGAPAHLRITGRSRHGVSVAWDPAPDEGQLDHYNVTINSMLCDVPPGVCSVTVEDAAFIKPGLVTIKVWAQGESGKSGPFVTAESWTLPEKPAPLPPPSGLRLEAGRFRWNSVPRATAYRVWRDGTPLPGTVTNSEILAPADEEDGFLQVAALDREGNISAKSEPLPIGAPPLPAACTLHDGGRSGRTLVLRWSRPAAGTCVGYRVEMENGAAWSPIVWIDDPWQDECIVGQKDTFRASDRDSLPVADEQPNAHLEPGRTYRFRVVELAPDHKEVPGPPLTLSTVALPSTRPVLRFAVILATDGRYDYLDKSLADAEAANCAFALIKGQIVPQLSSDPRQWDSLTATLHRHWIPCVLALLGSKDGWSEFADFSAAGASSDGIQIFGRYDMGPWRTGRPLDQMHTELGGALRMAGVLENSLGNPSFLPDLEKWVQQAEADPSCRWFFSGGVSTESAPSGVPGVMLQLYRPEMDFMRMINGDRGHELALDPGSNVACAAPQRNRVGAHYLVTVEDQRLVLESRQLEKKTGAFITDGLQEVRYDRAANQIAASNLRIPYPFGIATGLPRRADHEPPWTQNRIVACAPDGQADVQLLGHSASAAPLKFVVTRQPRHGLLTGTGNKLVYHPAPGFEGEDLFLYRADDGGRWPGNTAWVSIMVSAPEQAK